MGLCCRTHVTRCSILGVLVLASHFLCLKASDDIWWESSPLEGLKSFWILLALLNPKARAQWYLPVQDILLASFGFTIYLQCICKHTCASSLQFSSVYNKNSPHSTAGTLFLGQDWLFHGKTVALPLLWTTWPSTLHPEYRRLLP